MKRLTIGLALTAVVLSASPPVTALPRGLRVSTYRDNLDFPVDMAWVPGTKRIFFTEKNTGKVRILQGRRLLDRACVNLSVNASGESGALGVVLHPDFKQNHWLYVYYTNASPVENRVTRFTVNNNRCGKAKLITGGIYASSSYHNGGQLEFVGNKLFVSTGEGHTAAAAQRRGNRLGKILRYNSDGTIPRGNPFSTPGDRNPVWSYGHRNPFGLTHKPGSNWLFETENGPDCDDELNRILKGRNYGWGAGYPCGTAGVGINPKGPLKRWTPPIVPTDPWFYRGRMKAFSGTILMGDFMTGRLHRFKLNSTGTHIRRHSTFFNGSEGILDVTKGPGGWVYFATPDSIRRIHR